jgi:transcriptional regulator with XRE-family HTH domain
MLLRLKEYIDYKGISVSAFEKSIGMSNASFGKSLKSGGTIGADKLEIILNRYPDLNVIWLISGKGEMLKSEIEISEPPVSYGNLTIKAQSETIETLRKYVKKLEEEIDKLKSQKEKPAESGQKRKTA